jgi:hypothetical protein
LWTISDFPADVCSTGILSSWIPSGSTKPHWQLIDKNQWKKSNTLGESKKHENLIQMLKAKFHFKAFTQVCEVNTFTSLPEVITRMRSSDLAVALRASLVYRGLPVVKLST